MAKILVVDDEMGIRELLHEILEDENHEVLLAPHAAAARTIYAQTQLDLVLLDIWMPDIDGMTLLREWVSAGALRCPVIMMSGHASIDTALEANELGAVGFLEKPITLQRLLTTVHKILTRSSPLTLAHPSSESISTASHSNESRSTSARANMEIVAHKMQMQPLSTTQQTFTNLTKSQQALSNISLDVSLRSFRETSERIYFEHLLEHTQHSMTRVSEISELERTHLYRKFKQLGVVVKRQIKT